MIRPAVPTRIADARCTTAAAPHSSHCTCRRFEQVARFRDVDYEFGRWVFAQSSEPASESRHAVLVRTQPPFIAFSRDSSQSRQTKPHKPSYLPSGPAVYSTRRLAAGRRERVVRGATVECLKSDLSTPSAISR